MKYRPPDRRPSLHRASLVAAALSAAFGGAGAQDSPTAAGTPADALRRDLYTLESSASFGLGWVTRDNRRFGQSNGLDQQGLVALVDFDVVQRDESTGTWLRFRAKDLGLDSRELRVGQERQGDWSYALAASQFTRREPLTVRSGLQGEGTPYQVISASAAKRDLALRVDRDVMSFTARKFVLGGFDVQLSFRQDESQGARMFGRGTSNVMEFLTEPIDRVTRQWGVVASYADRRVQLTGGYNGSSYDNLIPVLYSSGGNNATNVFGPGLAMAMAPSNAAHQLHLAGGWNLDESSRASFKASHTVAVQDQPFDPVFVRLAGTPDSLAGKVVTSLVFAELTLRPLARMDLLAQVRFEDRDDQTPEQRWLASTPPTAGGSFSTAGFTGFNKPRSLRQTRGQVEAGWRFDGGYRVSAGVDQETLQRNVSAQYRRVGMRERTEESTARLDLKLTQSEVVNGTLALLHSERGGSEYVPDTYDPNALTNQVNAVMWADRRRDKLRLAADWLPDERWSVQFMADLSQDRYSGRALGPREGTASFLSADAHFKLGERWSLTGWLSQETTHARQRTRSDRVGATGAGYDTLWQADLRYTTQAAGLTLKGRLRSNLELGAELGGTRDLARHDLGQFGGNGAGPLASLPPITYRSQTLRLFADQPLQPRAGLRFELALERRRSNDWTWENWVYNGSPAVAAAARTSDGTTVVGVPRETVAFVGIKYHLRWK